MSEKTKIIEENWDYLVVLDACRFDYFRSIYKDFLTGHLKKVVSTGTETREWLRNTFTSYYDDIVYVSANPYVNSYGFSFEGFKATDHFRKIIDVWDRSWDEDWGTVLPHKVNKATLQINENFSSKRLIIHYMQPHAPYLCLDKDLMGIGKKDETDKETDKGKSFLKNKTKNIFNVFYSRFEKLFGRGSAWKIRETLNLPPIGPIDATLREVGLKGLKKAYRKNLTIVMKSVKELCGEFTGKIIITSDHGELLGENNDFGHRSGSSSPFLLEVPHLKLKER